MIIDQLPVLNPTESWILDEEESELINFKPDKALHYSKQIDSNPLLKVNHQVILSQDLNW